MMLSMDGDSLSTETLEKYTRSINQVLQLFNENKTKQLLLVRESKRLKLQRLKLVNNIIPMRCHYCLVFLTFTRYTTRIVDGLLQNIKLAKKLDYTAEEATRRFSALQVDIDSIRPKIQLLSKQSRELQTDLAKEISVKYNNRTVYITGGL